MKSDIDLQTDHERLPDDQAHRPACVVMNYPKEIKAFYMRLNDDKDGKTVGAMDVLAPGIGEIVGGIQREDTPGRAGPALG